MLFDLTGLLVIRGWILIASGWGLLVMWRLYKRGTQLDFPIVPPPLVKLTATFLALLFATVVWINVAFVIDAGWDDSPAGGLTVWERTVYGAMLVYALSCTLWIINVGIKGYRNGPKVDTSVLDAIVQGMIENKSIEESADP